MAHHFVRVYLEPERALAFEQGAAAFVARHASECGRDVWAVPGPLGAPECQGSNRLLADGAGVLWDVPEFVDAYTQGAVGPVPPGAALPVVCRGGM